MKTFRQLQEELLVEEPEYYVKMGLVTPDGKTIMGDPSIKTHEALATKNRLGKMIDLMGLGFVRWAVERKTNNIFFAWFGTKRYKGLTDAAKSAIINLIKKEPTFIGDKVELDIAGVGQTKLPPEKAVTYIHNWAS